ncbi:hypothetical protein KXJ75_23705 [Aeromonas sanarellii]|nr:hypothetical protein KXJ75_23705 [Aeromonas sanarellii]
MKNAACTQTVWVYDLRTNMPSFGKRTPFGNAAIGFTEAEFGTDPHLGPFEQVFGTNPNGTSLRTEGEYSFGAEKVELAEDAANQNTDPELARSRWRSFSREWIRDHKGDSLDISWLKDQNSVDAADLPEPLELANEAKSELEAALAELQDLVKVLGGVE